MEVLGINPVQRLVTPRFLASGLVALLLNSLVVIIGILGGYMFSVFIQDVNPGAFAAGITLLTGVPELIISCVKAALFGLIAGLVACYRGLTITGGGAKAVGNAVNETVVYAFMALFVINVIVTAIGIRMTDGITPWHCGRPIHDSSGEHDDRSTSSAGSATRSCSMGRRSAACRTRRSISAGRSSA